jgi:hypothetical protein
MRDCKSKPLNSAELLRSVAWLQEKIGEGPWEG